MMNSSGFKIDGLKARAFRIPTDSPEADGTFAWDSTTLVLVQASAGGRTGLGYTYTDRSAVPLVEGMLAKEVVGGDPFAIPRLWAAMVGRVRNVGWRGLAATAISAVDTALWDLKARLLDLPLATLMGQARERVPIYGSGGFTSYPLARLEEQLGRWVHEDGCRWVKMKVGTDPDADMARAEHARAAIGDAGLFVDANGAYSRKQALLFAERYAALGVLWFEEPVSSDDLDGLRLLRDRGRPG